MGNGFSYFFIFIVLGFLCWVCFLFGGLSTQDDLLSSYCESQSAQYEIVGEEYYCVKDNQLFQIEWVKE